MKNVKFGKMLLYVLIGKLKIKQVRHALEGQELLNKIQAGDISAINDLLKFNITDFKDSIYVVNNFTTLPKITVKSICEQLTEIINKVDVNNPDFQKAISYLKTILKMLNVIA